MEHSPFKFLDSYSEADFEIFYGRDQEIEEIYSKLLQSNLMLLYGPSGAGKTSILQCGVANRFTPVNWKPVFVRRKGDLMASLQHAINRTALKPLKDQDSIADQLYSVYLDYLTPIYLVFDQFEELFIFGSEQEKSEFVAALKEIVANKEINANVILSIREEYLANLSEFEDDIPSLFDTRVRVEKLKRAQAYEVIKTPCEKFDIHIGDQPIHRILELVTNESGSIELTWLQVLMDRLYRNAVEVNQQQQITMEDIAKIGKIGDILGNFLEQQLQLMEDEALGEAILKTFITNEGTKRQMTVEEIHENLKVLGKSREREQIQQTLQYFINIRILTDKDENDAYELKHDSLALKIYEKLTLYEKELLEIRQFLEYAHNNYLKRNILLSADDLQFIAPYEDKIILNKELEVFIRKSQQELSRKKRRRRAMWITSGVAFLAIMLGFTTWALLERSKAVEMRTVAEKQRSRAEQQKDLAEERSQEIQHANVLLEEAKNEAVNAKNIVENQLYNNIKNSLSVSPLKMNVLYAELENPLSIAASGIPTDKIIPYLHHENPTEAGTSARIKKSNGRYWVYNIQPQMEALKIGALGITNKGDTLDLGTRTFRVKQYPGPFVKIANHKRGNIPKEDLLAAQGLSIYDYSDFDIHFSIDAYDYAYYGASGSYFTGRSQGSALPEKLKNRLRKSQAGTRLVFSNVKIKGPGPFSKTLTSNLNFIVDGKAYESRIQSRNRVNQMMTLAKDQDKPALSYRVLKQAYHLDSSNKVLNAEILQAFMHIQEDYYNRLNSRLSDVNYLGDLGHFVLEEPVETGQQIYEQGLYQIVNGETRLVYALDFDIGDACYLDQTNQVMLLKENNTKVVVYERGRRKLDSTELINNDVNHIYPSPDGEFVVFTAATSSGFVGEKDNRAILLNRSTGNQMHLWGDTYRRTNLPEAIKDYTCDVKVSSAHQIIAAAFPREKKVEIWNLAGERIKTIPLKREPENIALTPKGRLLIKELGQNYNNQLLVYNLDDQQLRETKNPAGFTNFEFTRDGSYIIYASEEAVALYDNSFKRQYGFDNFDMPVWSDQIILKDNRIHFVGDGGNIVFPVESQISAVETILEDETIYGEIPELPERIKEQMKP